MMEWIRFVLGSIFLLIGLVIFTMEVFGIYKFKYVMNRMHAAAMGDTLGLSSSLLGLAIISGFNFDTLKMALLVVLFWITSPVSSHMLARMESYINKDVATKVRECSLKDIEAELREESK